MTEMTDVKKSAPELNDQLAYMIACVNRRLEDELADRLRPGGIPIEQFRILEALTQRGPHSMGELAASVLVERPTLTKIIDRMTAAGLVFRIPDDRDRRRVNIALAPEGEALYRRLSGVSAEQERQLAARLDADKAEALRELLRTLA